MMTFIVHTIWSIQALMWYVVAWKPWVRRYDIELSGSCSKIRELLHIIASSLYCGICFLDWVDGLFCLGGFYPYFLRESSSRGLDILHESLRAIDIGLRDICSTTHDRSTSHARIELWSSLHHTDLLVPLSMSIGISDIRHDEYSADVDDSEDEKKWEKLRKHRNIIKIYLKGGLF